MKREILIFDVRYEFEYESILFLITLLIFIEGHIKGAMNCYNQNVLVELLFGRYSYLLKVPEFV